MKTVRPIKTIMLGIALFANTLEAFSWGAKGHDIVCEIAQRHISKKTKQQIDSLFDGKSLVYWANWMDNASHTPEFKYTKSWHYKNIDADETYETAAPNMYGDVTSGIISQYVALKSGKLNKEQSAIALRMLIHMAGDMHCPMHMGHKSDLGGNKWQVRYFEYGSNLHKVWDSSILESGHKWAHTEWADEIDIDDEEIIAGIVNGTVNDWAKQTYTITCSVYDSTPKKSKLSFDYISKWTPIIEQQLLYGGLRLAYILNDIFKEVSE